MPGKCGTPSGWGDPSGYSKIRYDYLVLGPAPMSAGGGYEPNVPVISKKKPGIKPGFVAGTGFEPMTFGL